MGTMDNEMTTPRRRAGHLKRGSYSRIQPQPRSTRPYELIEYNNITGAFTFNVEEIVDHVDQSAYNLAQSGGVAWNLYARLLELTLYPVWSVRPLTFILTNTTGNIATFSVKMILLVYHLLMMWLNFIGYLLSASFILLYRQVKLGSKWLLGTESEQYEVNSFSEMASAENYAQWFSHATRYENEKSAPGNLQPKCMDEIHEWRRMMIKSRRANTFHSGKRSSKSATPDPIPIDNTFQRSGSLSLRAPVSKQHNRWHSLPLTVSEWRSYPMMSSFYPNLPAFRQFTKRLKQQMHFSGDEEDDGGYGEMILAREVRKIQELLDGWTLDQIVTRPDLVKKYLCAEYCSQTFRHILNDLREWSFERIGDQDLIFGVSYLGTHYEIEEQQSLFIKMLEMAKLLLHLYRELWDRHGVSETETNARLRVIRRMIRDYQQSFGSTVLALSGGGRLALAHIGVMEALESFDCLPSVISGSSGGAVFAALKCCLSEEEFKHIMPHLERLGAKMFPTLKVQLRNRVDFGFNLDYFTLGEVLRSYLGDITFEESYKKCGRQLCITATPAFLQNGIRAPILLNHVSTPNIIVWSAIVASCCLPILLPPVNLLSKRRSQFTVNVGDPTDREIRLSATQVFIPDGVLNNDIPSFVARLLRPEDVSEPSDFPCISDAPYGTPSNIVQDQSTALLDGYLVEPWGPHGVLWCDGSLSSDIPVKELQRLYGAKEIVCSQVNPHQAFFLEHSPHEEQNAMQSGSAFDSAFYYMKRFFELGVRQRYLKSTQLLLNPVVDGQDITEFWADRGTGTITISPCAIGEMHKVAKAPMEREIDESFKLARKRTWPHIPRIQFRCKIERALQSLYDGTR